MDKRNTPFFSYALKKHIYVFLDLLIFTCSYAGSFYVMSSVSNSPVVSVHVLETLPAVIILKYLLFHAAGVFTDITSYFSTHQFKTIVKTSVVSSLVLYSLGAFYQGVTGASHLPPYLFLIDCMCATFLLAVKRLIPLSFVRKGALFRRHQRKRVLIVGAGEAGELIVHAIIRTHRMPYVPVCFVDDDPYKKGKRIHGVPVVGTVAEIERITKENAIDEILIAIASASGKTIRRIIESAKKLKIPITTVPSLADLLNGKARVEEIRKVDKNDLLRRKPIHIDTTKVQQYVYGKSILITGAGGSIGSELVRQVIQFKPSRLLLLDHSEINVFSIVQEMNRIKNGVEVIPLLANITDYQRMEEIITLYKPEMIFHTAAYKHVSLLEQFPKEGFKNNVLGTKNLAQIALREGVKRFVLVSTDKAVDPLCVMGITKKIAELYVQGLTSWAALPTKFITVRFGNVLGSTGSVVTIFEDQIMRHEPLTVTHPEATRYFMTISEASQLIMQAGVMGNGGEVFLLKMGEPVKILDLARNLITLSGLVPDEDIKIAYTGLKPGEKLTEKLVGETESELPTVHDEITIVKNSIALDFEKLEHMIASLEKSYRVLNDEVVVERLSEIALSHSHLYPRHTA